MFPLNKEKVRTPTSTTLCNRNSNNQPYLSYFTGHLQTPSFRWGSILIFYWAEILILPTLQPFKLCTKIIWAKGMYLQFLKEKELPITFCFHINFSFKLGPCFESSSGKNHPLVAQEAGRDQPLVWMSECGCVNAFCYTKPPHKSELDASLQIQTL